METVEYVESVEIASTCLDNASKCLAEYSQLGLSSFNYKYPQLRILPIIEIRTNCILTFSYVNTYVSYVFLPS